MSPRPWDLWVSPQVPVSHWGWEEECTARNQPKHVMTFQQENGTMWENFRTPPVRPCLQPHVPVQAADWANKNTAQEQRKTVNHLILSKNSDCLSLNEILKFLRYLINYTKMWGPSGTNSGKSMEMYCVCMNMNCEMMLIVVICWIEYQLTPNYMIRHHKRNCRKCTR